MFTSAAPQDPLFWRVTCAFFCVCAHVQWAASRARWAAGDQKTVISISPPSRPLHGLAERFLQYARVLKADGALGFDESWGYMHGPELPSDTGVVCDWSAVTPGSMEMPDCAKETCAGHKEVRGRAPPPARSLRFSLAPPRNVLGGRVLCSARCGCRHQLSSCCSALASATRRSQHHRHRLTPRPVRALPYPLSPGRHAAVRRPHDRAARGVQAARPHQALHERRVLRARLAVVRRDAVRVRHADVLARVLGRLAPVAVVRSARRSRCRGSRRAHAARRRPR